MTEAEWLTCDDPTPMLEVVRSNPRQRRPRLFCCACIRHTPLGDGRKVWDLLTDPRSRRAVELAELYADDLATEDEMDAARHLAHRLADELRDVALHAAASPGRTDVAFTAFSIRNAVVTVVNRGAPTTKYDDGYAAQRKICEFFRDVYGPLPFRSLPFDFGWASSTVMSLAEGIYQERAFDRLPILADALEDVGCSNQELLAHCRGPGEHVRGCWLLDLVLGRELQPHDLQIDLVRLADGRRLMRAVHCPTGIFTEGIRTHEERLWFLKERLIKDLARKVWSEMRGAG
ncbi:MAG: hypothetical protein K2R98_05380 [Gemmataceae bacterium]|nr:hypothetical protein [Gemmataceae bacterium]